MAIIPSNENRNIIIKEAGPVGPDSRYSGMRLYHYCNPHSFLGILKSKELWLTSTEFLNDWAECLLVDFVFETRNPEIREKLKQIRSWVSFDYIIENYNRIKNIPLFVCSFSTENDSLGQWVHYANHGVGFCIEFNADDVNYIGQICWDEKPTITPTDFRYLLLEKVIYSDPTASIEVQEALIDEIIKVLKMWGGNPWLGAIQLALLNARVKHDSFTGENEYRMIYLNSSKDPSRMISNLDYRVCGNNTIAPYYSMSLPRITKVGIGPRNSMKTEQVEAMLAEMGFKNVSAFKSSCTLR